MTKLEQSVVGSSIARKSIVIVGGGVAGLSAAHRIMELDPSVQVTLLEATDRLGGILRTETIAGFQIEQGADSFLVNLPWANDLCKRVGIEHDLEATNEDYRQTYVVCRGRLEKVPKGFLLMSPTNLWSIVSTPILSMRGKARLAAELLVPARRSSGDESLASFACRRLGRETFERLVQPLAAGIYSADAERLSLSATLPRFVEAERKHRSLILAARRDRAASSDSQSSGARYSQFVSPRAGMESFPNAIAARLPADVVRLRQRVTRIERIENHWRIYTDMQPQPIAADGLVLSASLPVAAKLLASVEDRLASELAGIEHAGMAIVSLGYQREQIKRLIPGFGFVVPAIEKRQLLAASISSNKFSGRAPAEHVLIRAFLGGAGRDDLLDWSDEKLHAAATGELRDLLGVEGTPVLAKASRWRNVMPQYHVGHQERVASIETQIARIGNLAIAGNALHGVGIPQVVRSGEVAAESILSAVASLR